MIELLLFIIGCMLSGVVGWTVREIVARRQLSRLQDQIIAQLPKIDSIPIRIDKIDSMIYVYNDSTGQFMAQGTTYKEIGDKMIKLFPNTLFLATEADAKDMGGSDERF